MTNTPAAHLNLPASRFEIAMPHGVAVLTFKRSGNTIDLQHAFVPPALEGGGYGSTLARAALDYARDHQLKVIPTCEFVQAFMKRHTEYDDLRDSAT
ncbi:hypothetical protein BH11GEM2_BH11GEM2_14800 [soil metagenome]